jgi:hypothetical protein
MTHHESRPQAPQAPTDATSSTTSSTWLYACPRCCAQSTTAVYIGPTQQQLLRKQHRPGCKSTYKVLIGQVPLPAAQLQATSTPIARDQTSVLVLMLQRSNAATLLIRAAVRALTLAGEPDDLFLSTARQQLESAAVLLSGSEEPAQAQYADFSGEKPRRLCNNCAQPASAHPVEITREGRRLVCVLRPSDQVPQREWPEGSTLPHARFTVTEAGRAALSESDVL